MTNRSISSLPILRVYLLPYIFLLILYFLIIGVGSTWLYLTARHAQTELVTGHIVDVASPFLKQLSEEHQKNKTAYSLSTKVHQLYQALPHLREISIRDRQRGYGVRLTSKKQLVDVELEPLTGELNPIKSKQQLAKQLHNETAPLFHIYINFIVSEAKPIQMDVAFDRAGLVGNINTALQSIIHSIVGFSLIGLLSILIALGITLYTGFLSKKMEARLQKIYHQASMGALSASLVHDLRNPLSSIRANINNLLITPDETALIVDEMDHDLLRLEHKLSDFLKFTKPKDNNFELIHIEPLIHDVVRECTPLAKQKNITISVDMMRNIPLIHALQSDLRDALFNILVNAIQHTYKQGHIDLFVHLNQAQLEMIIEDDGASILTENLTTIFKPFFTTRTEGHGLGLAIVKRTIEAHDGQITAENRLPSGARFIILLPLAHYE